MKKNLIILGLGLSLLSCKTTTLHVSNVQTHKSISISEEYHEASDFTTVITPYKVKLDDAMKSKISYTDIELTRNGNNSKLGNLLADYTFDGANEWAKKNLNITIDAAVINIGGIRNNINKGDITTRSIFEVMPFENEIVIVKMSGEELEGLFEYYEKYQKNNPVSRLTIETENNKLTKALINGKEVNEDQTYHIATSDYLALGGDNMEYFSEGKMITTGLKMRDLFLDYFKRNPKIEVKEDIRLKFNGVQ